MSNIVYCKIYLYVSIKHYCRIVGQIVPPALVSLKVALVQFHITDSRNEEALVVGVVFYVQMWVHDTVVIDTQDIHIILRHVGRGTCNLDFASADDIIVGFFVVNQEIALAYLQFSRTRSGIYGIFFSGDIFFFYFLSFTPPFSLFVLEPLPCLRYRRKGTPVGTSFVRWPLYP